MISVVNGISLWYRPCYENILNCNSDNKCRKLTAM